MRKIFFLSIFFCSIMKIFATESAKKNEFIIDTAFKKPIGKNYYLIAKAMINDEVYYFLYKGSNLPIRLTQLLKHGKKSKNISELIRINYVDGMEIKINSKSTIINDIENSKIMKITEQDLKNKK